MAPFSEERRSYDDTRKRTGADYVKFTPEYRTVLRILDPKARTVWKHFISVANQGRGMGAVCPNVTAGLNVCPIELSVADLPRDSQERRSANASRKFLVNVLDRTPYTTCNSCGNQTPAKVVNRAKQCTNCGASLKDHDFAPLNKIKVLESGPKIFNEQLNAIEEAQAVDFEDAPDITYYDITFTAQGQGRDRVVTALPQDPKPLEEDALIDPETGEEQKRWDLELLAEPATVEEITLMLQGATIEQLNAVRGIN